MYEYTISKSIDFKTFEKIKNNIQKEYNAKIIEDIYDPITYEERYCDIKINERYIITLHQQFYLGIIIYTEDKTAYTLCKDIIKFLQNKKLIK